MFITYKITCTITGKYYIGSHKTDNIDDGYMGSGRLIRKSIEEYGVENHTKEILGVFSTREESLELEHTLVKEGKLTTKDSILNISNGGFSFNYINDNLEFDWTEYREMTEKRKIILRDLPIIIERHRTESYRKIASDYGVSGNLIKNAVKGRLSK